MPQPFTLAFRPQVTLVELSDEHAVLQTPASRIPVTGLSAGMLVVLRRLSSGGATEDALGDLVLAEDGPQGLAPFYFFLQSLAARQFLRYSIVQRSPDGDALLATLTPMGPGGERARAEVAPTSRVRLSRFAYCRRDGDELVLETPLAPARVTLYGTAGAAAFGVLAQPATIADLRAALPELAGGASAALLQMLVNAAMIAETSPDGSLPEDESVPLRQWEFHDLLFQARSREGRHNYPFGDTFRFLKSVPPLSAIKPPMAGETIPLVKPDLDRLAREDLPLSHALETRRSVREYGEQPITLAQLSEFLYRVAGVRQVFDADPEHGVPYQTSRRPYPSGGAAYDIELYISINRCDGLEPGLYHYDPLVHQLERLSGLTPQVQALLRAARWSTGLSDGPPVLITLASRFQRLSWKYQSIAYAIVLKNTGVLYQTMYLVATAMGLAPCGLGYGNADLFAEAAGLDYYAETSVGEFMLGSLPRG